MLSVHTADERAAARTAVSPDLKHPLGTELLQHAQGTTAWVQATSFAETGDGQGRGAVAGISPLICMHTVPAVRVRWHGTGATSLLRALLTEAEDGDNS